MLRKIGYILLAGMAFFVVACEGQSGEESGDIFLDADKSSITADGNDAVTFTVFAGNTDVTADVVITCVNDGSVLEGSSFSTVTTGTYSFTASYGDRVSIPVSVTAEQGGTDVPLEPSKFVREVCIMYFTYQTCAFCPSGYRYLDMTVDIYGQDILHILSLHSAQGGDIMAFPQEDEIATDMKVQGYPSASVDMRQTLSLTNEQSLLDPAIEAAFGEYAAHCGVAVKSDYDEASGSAEITAKLYSEQTSVYRLAVYVVENNIVASQTEGQVTRPDYVHHHVARKLLSSTYKGDNLGTVEKDATHTSTYNVSADPEWNLDNTSVYALAIDEQGYVNNMAVCQFKNGETPFNYAD